MADIKDWTSTRQIWNGVFTLPIPIPPANQLYKLLASGATIDMSVDGSSTAVEFEYECPADKVVFIEDITILIIDAGIVPTKFGGIAALTNGLLIEAIGSDGTTVLHDFTEDKPIKKNADWFLLTGHDSELSSPSGDDTEEVQWNLAAESGPLLLTEGQLFRVTVRDNLLDITEMEIMVQGDIFPDGIFNDA